MRCAGGMGVGSGCGYLGCVADVGDDGDGDVSFGGDVLDEVVWCAIESTVE